MILSLTLGYARYRRDEISVVQDGVPIPYKWIDGLTIEVDDCFERAAILITPRPRGGLFK